MKGYLRSSGINVSIPRILDSMRRVAPVELEIRRTFAQRRLIRRSLYAPYFGYQLSIDQNEKLRHYGIIFFAGVDACTRYVVFLFATPQKMLLHFMTRDIGLYSHSSSCSSQEYLFKFLLHVR